MDDARTTAIQALANFSYILDQCFSGDLEKTEEYTALDKSIKKLKSKCKLATIEEIDAQTENIKDFLKDECNIRFQIAGKGVMEILMPKSCPDTVMRIPFSFEDANANCENFSML